MKPGQTKQCDQSTYFLTKRVKFKIAQIFRGLEREEVFPFVLAFRNYATLSYYQRNIAN